MFFSDVQFGYLAGIVLTTCNVVFIIHLKQIIESLECLVGEINGWVFDPFYFNYLETGAETVVQGSPIISIITRFLIELYGEYLYQYIYCYSACQ